jgi:hypothetical protein
MSSSLASRLGDIPGVASVVIDLDGFGRGIDVRLEPGADEVAVMEQLRALLAAYGVRNDRHPSMNLGRAARAMTDLGVDVSITPTDGGARVEVSTANVKSFRLVSTDPVSVAQGLADAWCEVIGRLPIEVVSVEVGTDASLTVVANDGEHDSKGSSSTTDGWFDALTSAVGNVLGNASRPQLKRAAS